MSRLSRSDHDLHYSDNSHRWVPPTDVAEDTWKAVVQAHMNQHATGTPGQSDAARRLPSELPESLRTMGDDFLP